MWWIMLSHVLTISLFLVDICNSKVLITSFHHLDSSIGHKLFVPFWVFWPEYFCRTDIQLFSSFPLQQNELNILRQCVHKKISIFSRFFLKCSPKVILIILYLQCGNSHDVQRSSERPQFNFSHLFLCAILKCLSCIVIQEGSTFVIL